MIVVAAVAFTACNNNTAANEHEGHDMHTPAKDTTQHTAAPDDKELKTITAVFTNVDAKAAATIKEIVDHYLHIKNALTNDDAGNAADGAKADERAAALASGKASKSDAALHMRLHDPFQSAGSGIPIYRARLGGADVCVKERSEISAFSARYLQ